MGTEGTPAIATLDYLYIGFTSYADTTTITSGDLAMDYWRLEDIDSPDTSDVDVYYTTYDDNNVRIFGSKKTVTAILSREGRVEMTTAPTSDDDSSTGAEAGVFIDYAYVSENMDWNLLNSAASYMAAHLCSLKIAGQAPNYDAIADAFMRRDIAGSPDEWLRLCYSLLINAVGEDNTGIGFRRVETNVET